MNEWQLFCDSCYVYDKTKMSNRYRTKKDKIEFWMKRELIDEIQKKYKHIHTRISITRNKKKSLPFIFVLKTSYVQTLAF